MLGRVGRWGNSLAVRIPAAIAGQAGIAQGSEVHVVLSEGAIVIEAVDRHAPDLGILLAGIDPSSRHAESDWGTVFPWSVR